MLIRVTDPHEPLSSEITPRSTYLIRPTRREALLTLGLAAASLPSLAQPEVHGGGKLPKLTTVRSGVAGSMVMDKPTSYADATSYNNFYEFGTDKSDPASYAHTLKTRPWTVSVEGECAKPMRFDIETLLKLSAMEDRIYRLRCVEGWSMVVPWVGYSLAEVIKKVEPTSKAKYVEFTSLADKAQMPGVRSGVLDWPYVEGLRMDEAMHPLAMLVFGMYGEVLPNQNGAPLRLALPWKYGFKSAKSIVKIRLLEKEPVSSWTKAAQQEYGFYSNVNPNVPHPRWSQASERRIGEDGLFAKKRPTLMFNGYEPQVGQLYAGMDLKKFY
ncbi:MAG: protein-methionine-sulfoxide reductase catalytic subunit MsrP [Burkholderiales bacterium]|nr:MAG: protein-methionine-sulfoxide reductase catalytic subunit MsrP [Burkholderiales bacterium]